MNYSNFHRQLWCGMTVWSAVMLAGRVSAADAPADASATPAPAPAAAPAAGGSWFVFSPPKDGVVLPPAQREKLLTLSKSFLERDAPDMVAHLKAVPNPYYPKLAPPPEAVTTNTTTNAAPVPVSVLQDGDKLQQVVDQLKPTGALIGGSNRLIIFSSGDTLGEGASIQVTFPGDAGPSAVTLQNVSSDSYTLKLRDTVKTFPYAAKSSSASRPPPSTTPSKPPSRD